MAQSWDDGGGGGGWDEQTPEEAEEQARQEAEEHAQWEAELAEQEAEIQAEKAAHAAHQKWLLEQVPVLYVSYMGEKPTVDLMLRECSRPFPHLHLKYPPTYVL